MANRSREVVFSILNWVLVLAKDRNLVSVYIQPACAVVSPKEIAKQVKQALSKYLEKHITDTSYQPNCFFGYFKQFSA